MCICIEIASQDSELVANLLSTIKKNYLNSVDILQIGLFLRFTKKAQSQSKIPISNFVQIQVYIGTHKHIIDTT